MLFQCVNIIFIGAVQNRPDPVPAAQLNRVEVHRHLAAQTPGIVEAIRQVVSQTLPDPSATGRHEVPNVQDQVGEFVPEDADQLPGAPPGGLDVGHAGHLIGDEHKPIVIGRTPGCRIGRVDTAGEEDQGISCTRVQPLQSRITGNHGFLLTEPGYSEATPVVHVLQRLLVLPCDALNSPSNRPRLRLRCRFPALVQAPGCQGRSRSRMQRMRH